MRLVVSRDGARAVVLVCRTLPIVRWCLVAAVALGTVVGCGDGSPSTSDESASVASAAGAGVNRRVGERCPAEFEALGDHGDGSGTATEARRLEPTLAAVSAYGDDHPDAFAGYGLVWHTPGDASAFAAFKGDIAAHRQALRSLVAFPDELVVCRAVLSREESRALVDELRPELAELFASTHVAVDGAIAIGLPVASEPLAADFVQADADARPTRGSGFFRARPRRLRSEEVWIPHSGSGSGASCRSSRGAALVVEADVPHRTFISNRSSSRCSATMRVSRARR